ncbi:MAG TPA: VCBS domain-containing protein, partial [Trichocoleus sp.]
MENYNSASNMSDNNSASLFQLVNSSSSYSGIIAPIEADILNQLTNWFSLDDFLTQAAVPFGATADSSSWADKALSLKQLVLNGNYSIDLEIRSNSELGGASGAYSSTGTTGQATIYLNADWLITASSDQIQAVLLEELGHSFDDQINGGLDSDGDEGAIFSGLVRGINFDANQLVSLKTENDSKIITLDGQQISVEQAITFDPASPAWTNLGRTGDPNKGTTDASWTAASSDFAGNETTPYLQVQSDGTSIAFKVLAEPQSGTFKALMGIFVDIDADGSPDLTIQVNVNDVSGGYKVVEYDFIPIFKGITADANTRPNNTAIPGANTGTYFNLKDSLSLDKTSNLKVYGPAGSDGVVDRDVDADGKKENYYVFSFTLAQLASFRDKVAKTYNSNNPGSVYKEIPQWPAQQTSIYAAGLSASNSLNAVNGDVGGGAYGTSTPWKEIFGFTPPLPPVGANDTAIVLEDSLTAVTGNLLANDTDPNKDPLRVSQFTVAGTTYSFASTTSQTVTLPSGILTIASDGTYSFKPAANYAGPVPIVTYTVSDGALTSTATLSISITSVNDAPDGTNKTITSDEDTTYTFSASDFGFTDPNDSPANSLQSVVITTLPTTGTLKLNGNAITAGTEITAANIPFLIYTPVANGNGTNYANFTFQVRDNGGTANGGANLDPTPNTITFNVIPVNDAPVAVTDTATAVEAGGANNQTVGTNPAGNVLTHDTDVDAGDTKTVVSVINPVASSTISIPTLGSTSISNPASVSGQYGTLAIGADGSYIYTVDNNNSVVQSLRLSTNTLTDTFIYIMKDSAGVTSSSTLTVTVQGANDNPVANPDYNTVALVTNTTQTVTGNLLTNDTDVDTGDTKKLRTGSSTTGSTPTSLTGVTLTTAVPNNTNITGYFVFLVGTNSLTLLKDTTGANLKVSTYNGTSVTFSGTPQSIAVGSTLRFDANTNGNGNGNVFTSTVQALNYSSAASTTIVVASTDGIYTNSTISGSDSNGVLFSRTITNVDSANKTITIGGAALSLNANSNLTFSASGSVTLKGLYGTLTLTDVVNSGAYSYTNNSNLAAGNYSDVFNYTMLDAAGATGSSSLTINLSVQASIPTVVADTGTAIEAGGSSNNIGGGDATGNVISNDLNPPGSTLSVSSFWSSQTNSETPAGTSVLGLYGSLTINSNGSYTYKVENSNSTVERLRTNTDTLTETFFYRLSNGSATNVGTLTITTRGNNDAPVGVADISIAEEAGGTSNGTPGFNATGNVLTNDRDKDTGDTKTVSAVIAGTGTPTTLPASVVGAYGTLVLAANGTYTYVVDDNNATVNALGVGQTRQDIFTYQVKDLDGLTSNTTLIITINGADDAPVNTVPTTQTVNESAPLLFTGLNAISVNDIDGNLTSTQLTVTNGKITVDLISGGAQITSGTNGSSTLTLSGTQTQINAALATLRYQGNSNFSGADTLTILAKDSLGLQDIDTVAITVTPDNRALTVNSPLVNEGSPYVVFTVTGANGAIGQKVDLGLTNGSATSGNDFAPNLEYWNGNAWTAYMGTPVTIPSTIPGGGDNSTTAPVLYVRTQILNDQVYENSETFQLTVKNSAGTSFIGTATVKDDSTGTTFNNNGVSDGTANGSFTKDDDRLITVSSPIVNEASPYAVFEVSGAPNQWARLGLTDGSAIKLSDYGSNLQYWNVNTWKNYTDNSFIQIPAGGKLLVRTSILNDAPATYEGPENFALTATNTGGKSTQGTATIVDDGTGTKYLETVTNGIPDTSTNDLDNDLQVKVVATTPINEGSTYALFTVTGTAGQSLFLTLGNTADTTDKDAIISGFT